MYIKVSQTNWLEQTGRILYQNPSTLEIIGEVETASGDYEEVTEVPFGFLQRVHEGCFGVELSFEQIAEIDEYKSNLTDEEIGDCSTLGELKRQYQISLMTDEVDTLALEILDLKGV